jgi:homoserine kinase type II
MADGAVWYLRINEGKPMSRLRGERDLLRALSACLRARTPVQMPHMATSVAGDVFYAVDRADGRRWASLFAGLPGREIAVFEVAAAHARAVGTFLATMHIAMRQHRAGPNPFGAQVVTSWLPQLLAFEGTRATALFLQSALHSTISRRRLLPRGLIHGDLFIDNTRWAQQASDGEPTLRAVFDWEMAGRDHLALDVAIAVCAWTFWRREGVLEWRHDVAAALLDAYQRVRPFSRSEVRGFHTELRLAAIRFAASRLKDFGLPSSAVERRALDPQDYVERLHAIDAAGARHVAALLQRRP